MLHVQIGKLIYLTRRGPGLSLKIEDEGRNKKVDGGSGGLAYSYIVLPGLRDNHDYKP